MFLLIGLGNPGKEYANTRHNIGFSCLEYIRTQWKFPAFRENSSFRAECSEEKIGTEKVILARPKTFMNRSGDAAQKIAHFYKIEPRNIIVIHDDLDIPLGKVRESFGSRSAGHNGVEDIIGALGTKDFFRFRIGIKGVAENEEKNQEKDTSAFVLESFPVDELEKAQQTFPIITEKLRTFIENTDKQ